MPRLEQRSTPAGLPASPELPRGEPEGGAPQLGPAHEAKAGLTYLGSGSAAGAEALERLRQAGMVDESNPAEMGGGGDPIDDWVVKKGGYNKLLQQIQQNKWADNMVWTLGDGTKLSVAEVRRRAATAVTPPPPEPQPAPRLVDWRDTLQKDQKERLKEFDMNVSKFDVVQLGGLLSRIKQLQALAPIDGWQGKGIKEADADLCLKIIAEKLQPAFTNRVNQLPSERLDPMQSLSEAARAHVQFLIDKFRKDNNLEKLDFSDLVAYVQAEYKKAGLVGRNAPSWLLPPHLKGELLPVFGLSLEIPLPLEPKEKNART